MRKLFTIIGFVLLYFGIALGQASIDIPLSASDGSATIQLAVGLDLTATNGIDAALGESDLPPFPPPGVFEFRFDLTPYAGEPLSSYKDYRAPGDPPSFPFSDTVQHRMMWQRSDAGLPIDIQYDLPTNSKMVIQDEFGGVILNLGPFEGIGTATIPGNVPLTAAFLYMIYTGIIPVELTSFTAISVDQAVLLSWRTATETNNRGFEIQRQQGSDSWEKLGFVAGKGTTTEPQVYSYKDNDVSSGTYTYRLKQIDYDGSFYYSNEVQVNVNAPVQFSLSQNYPNPFNPTTVIQYQVPKTSDVIIKIYDLLGQEIKTLFTGQVQQGTYKVEWNGLNNEGIHMSSGTYIYRITTGEFTQSMKMILMK
jgi:hypothetical protein